MRPRGVLPDDPLVHAAVLVFASDRGLLSTAARPHGLMWGGRQGMSLDHTARLHGQDHPPARTPHEPVAPRDRAKDARKSTRRYSSHMTSLHAALLSAD